VLKALIFDLGNVLVAFDFKRAYARLEPLTKCSTEDIRARLRSTGLVHRFETGQVAPEQFVEEFSRLLEFKTTYAEFCELWSCIFLPGTLIPESLVASLASRYRLVLLSNTNPIHFSMIQAGYPILAHFHDFILSHEVGATKPCKKIYEEAIRRSGCSAVECFFTDDMLVNVEAASALGMDAVQFLSAGQIESELRRRGAL
jgi:glucose-1-phosphatase